MAKRTIDILVSLAALAVLSPALLAIAVVVTLDSRGPSLFRQTRVGRGGRLFVCYKFRTMRTDSPDIRNPDGSTFNAPDDSRVTRVGRILRKTTLDELPQLVNVLKGDMSLVGPRPDLPDQVRYYSEHHRKRLLVRPGMTGWAWIHGRNSIPWERRLDLDVEYVDRQSLWLDLYILLRTVPMVITGRGVYVPPGTPREKNGNVQT